MRFSLHQLFEEALRECALREKVYPHQVASRKMRQSVADFHQARMRANADFLRLMMREADKDKAVAELVGRLLDEAQIDAAKQAG